MWFWIRVKFLSLGIFILNLTYTIKKRSSRLSFRISSNFFSSFFNEFIVENIWIFATFLDQKIFYYFNISSLKFSPSYWLKFFWPSRDNPPSTWCRSVNYFSHYYARKTRQTLIYHKNGADGNENKTFHSCLI
jgi:hypothetical protein